MSWTKKATVAYHFIESADEDFFSNFNNDLNTILDNGDASGSFESGDIRYIWKINSKINLTDTDSFIISLVKERLSWPVWFNDDGDIDTIPLPDGAIGELSYALINPLKKFMLSMAASGGSATGGFKKLLNEFSQKGVIKTIPLFEENIDKKTLLWDYYKKIGLSLNFPTHDDLAEFNTTKEGRMLGLLDELGGLKIDVTISAPKQKQVLNNSQLRESVQNLLENDFCTKLVVRGSEFDYDEVEEYDLKNAQVKYSEHLEINGTYMTIDEAKGVLLRAMDDRMNDLLS